LREESEDGPPDRDHATEDKTNANKVTLTMNRTRLPFKHFQDDC
jgi:hypothetical protein